MNDNISLLVKDIPRDEVDNFVKSTKSNIEANESIKNIKIDYSWIDVIEDAIPSLDSIIRNPRRFIVSEEDVVRIEKTKKVTLESIKDLAVHTNYIQEVDDDGFVKPIKLLNVFKEETIDLYENRFIYSLINKVTSFVDRQLEYMRQSEDNSKTRSLKYVGSTKYNNEDVSITLDLSSVEHYKEVESEEVLIDRQNKLKHINNVLDGFSTSKFMLTMKNATEVRSPIRKTNLILKDTNFNKALHLWEYIERFEISNPVQELNEENDLFTNSMGTKLDLTYFLNYSILNNLITKNGDSRVINNIDIISSVYEYAKNYDVDEKELRKKLEDKINEALTYKNECKSSTRKALKQFVENHNSRYSKANNLFK